MNKLNQSLRLLFFVFLICSTCQTSFAQEEYYAPDAGADFSGTATPQVGGQLALPPPPVPFTGSAIPYDAPTGPAENTFQQTNTFTPTPTETLDSQNVSGTNFLALPEAPIPAVPGAGSFGQTTTPTTTTTGPTITAPAAPTASAPTVSAPTASAPTASAPTASAPTASAPTASAPTASAPTVSAPTASAPTVSAPTVSAPTASAPTASAPTASAPTASAPTASAPTASAPTASAPTATIPGIAAPGTTAGTPSVILPSQFSGTDAGTPDEIQPDGGAAAESFTTTRDEEITPEETTPTAATPTGPRNIGGNLPVSASSFAQIAIIHAGCNANTCSSCNTTNIFPANVGGSPLGACCRQNPNNPGCI